MSNGYSKTICELFAGVGGFRLGFERLNSGWETVWFSQWEPSSRAQWAHDCYVQHFGDSSDVNGYYNTNEDIAVVNKNDIPDHTLLVGGFPCQDYSVAQSLSTSKGIEGKKGVLWWQIKNILDVKKPPFCILENVDRLIASPANQRGRDFGIILACFYDLGYSVEWRVVNAAEYGAAQKRRRTFIFAYRNDTDYGKKMSAYTPYDILDSHGFMARSFPVTSVGAVTSSSVTRDILDISDNFSFEFKKAGYMHDGNIYTAQVKEALETHTPLGDILQTDVSDKYYITDEETKKFEFLKGKKSIPRVSKSGFEYTFSEGAMPFPDSLNEPGRTILTSESSASRSTHIVRDPETQKLRKLTPVEVERMNGFDDDWTKTGMPDSARYFCMGNSLVVPMVTKMGTVMDSIVSAPRNNKVLRDYQLDAIKRMRNGCILCGGVGSGKSRTAIGYYYVVNGGKFVDDEYVRMTSPKDLYIITTAKKRDSLEWEAELPYFHLTNDPALTIYPDMKIVIDSWNNIQKYKNVYGAFFVFDEQRVVGKGAWVKTFLNIARKNQWILLSATPGDKWEDYRPVFIANGFYRNKTDFDNQHIVWNPRTNFPSISKYLDVERLTKYRDMLLVDMDFTRNTIAHHEDIYVKYDIHMYKDATRFRKDPYKPGYIPCLETDPDGLLIGRDITIENVKPILDDWYYEPREGEYVKLSCKPIKTASELCYVWRKIVNTDESRQAALLELFEDHPKMIVFYNFDYELDILKGLYYGDNVEIAEWNGHKHQPVPEGERWVYLVQYTAGAEGWNCIRTDTIVFYSQNYSYKVMQQAAGRIDRLNTPYLHLHYYHLKSRSGIDLAISRALKEKKQFNENRFVNRNNHTKAT